jgi:hypothetical protein
MHIASYMQGSCKHESTSDLGSGLDVPQPAVIFSGLWELVAAVGLALQQLKHTLGFANGTQVLLSLDEGCKTYRITVRTTVFTIIPGPSGILTHRSVGRP